MENLFKALGDENRLRILNLLSVYELCVCELEILLDLNQSNVSRHLGKLKIEGIITWSKDAQWIHYKLSEEFKNQNSGIINYLSEKFSGMGKYAADMKKCRAYVESPLNCQDITNDRESVLKFLEATVKSNNN
jgi:ArsR family transcriptional regulator